MEGATLATNIGEAVTSGVSTVVESIGTATTGLVQNDAIVYFIGIGLALTVIAFVVRKFLPRFRG